MAKKEYLPEKASNEVEAISPVYRQFKHDFGESDAKQILLAGAHMRERTHRDDWFVDCIVVAIAYECFTTYHDQHELSRPSDEYISWIKENIDFSQHQDDTTGGTVLTGNKKKFSSLGLI